MEGKGPQRSELPAVLPAPPARRQQRSLRVAAVRPHPFLRTAALRACSADPCHPAPRANPCPEVTDLFCRLPLPTLSCRLEASNLGDLMRIRVRLGGKIILSPRFSRADGCAPDAAKAAALCRASRPISGRSDSGAALGFSARQEEKRTLPGAAAGVSRFVCVTASLYPHPSAGILTRFPFGVREG